MKYIIIDDDNNKVGYFERCLEEEDTIIKFNNYKSGMKEIINNHKAYDILILDMNFPLSEGKPEQVNMGMMVLIEMDRRKMTLPTIVYSSSDFRNNEYSNIIGSIKFSPGVLIDEEVKRLVALK